MESVMQENKAVLVAKDVLKRLRYLNVSTNIYLKGVLEKALPKNEDLKEHVAEVQKKCQVCALGACLLSKARLYDKVPLSSIGSLEGEDGYWKIYAGCDSSTRIFTLLKDVFDLNSLSLMETAFE